jgi:hypothetical protein
MANTTIPGTSKELLAHVAAWHDRTARRLRVFRATGTYPDPGDEAALRLPALADEDDFDARVSASHRLVGAEALLDELDAAFRTLRAEVAQLEDDQIHATGDWAVAIVRGNTDGHYAEHARELGIG